MLRICFLFILLVSIGTQIFSQELTGSNFGHTNGVYKDSRDGQSYATITFEKMIGAATIKRTWYAENNRFFVDGSYCYKDEDAYCEAYGRLYNYKQAQTACPEGWHVPTIKEWEYLFTFFGGRHKAGKFLVEGKESDMHMLYGGFGEPGHIFKDITISGNWWDNELKSENEAGIITLINGSSEIYHEVIGDKHKLSCRCVQKHD